MPAFIDLATPDHNPRSRGAPWLNFKNDVICFIWTRLLTRGDAKFSCIQDLYNTEGGNKPYHLSTGLGVVYVLVYTWIVSSAWPLKTTESITTRGLLNSLDGIIEKSVHSINILKIILIWFYILNFCY